MNPVITLVLPSIIEAIKGYFTGKNTSVEQAQQYANDLAVQVLGGVEAAIAQEVNDRDSARKLAAQDAQAAPAWASAAAAFVRPAWGFGSLVLYSAHVLGGYAISPLAANACELVIMFYFGGRTIEKLTPFITKAWGKN